MHVKNNIIFFFRCLAGYFDQDTNKDCSVDNKKSQNVENQTSLNFYILMVKTFIYVFSCVFGLIKD